MVPSNTAISGKSVWILENDPAVRSITGAVARMLGYRVLTFTNLADACSKLCDSDSAEIAPNIVISDLDVDEGVGEAWLYLIRDRYPKATIVCFGSFLTPALTHQLGKLGIGSMKKPVTLQQVFRLLEKAAEGWSDES